MNTKITTSTLEEMLGQDFEKNKSDFAAKLRKQGLSCSEKTIIRALENDSMGAYIPIDILTGMCEQYRFPFARCFTFYNVNGIEKAYSHEIAYNPHTDKTIQTNLLELANDICNSFPRLSMVKSEMGFELDFMQLANENIHALKDIAATEFVEKLMDKHLDVNKYIWQEGFALPYQYSGSTGMVSEDISPTNEQIYLSAYLGFKIEVRNNSIDMKCKIKEMIERRKKQIDSDCDFVDSISEFLMLVKDIKL